MQRNRCLTPDDLSENPALGILSVLEESMRLARLALCGVHSEMLSDEPFAGEDYVAAKAYAFAILFQMRALEDTIRSYTLTVEDFRDAKKAEDSEEDACDMPPF